MKEVLKWQEQGLPEMAIVSSWRKIRPRYTSVLTTMRSARSMPWVPRSALRCSRSTPAMLKTQGFNCCSWHWRHKGFLIHYLQSFTPRCRFINVKWSVWLFNYSHHEISSTFHLTFRNRTCIMFKQFIGCWPSPVKALALGARNRKFESFTPDHNLGYWSSQV